MVELEIRLLPRLLRHGRSTLAMVERRLECSRRRSRTVLAAFGLGSAVAAATVAVILWVTNDMRWMLLLGSVGLLGSALWAGSRRRGGAVAFLLVSSLLPEGRQSSVSIAALSILVAGGTWYALTYVPDAIAGALSRTRDEPAPEFTFETLEGSSYPVEPLESKVVVIVFFATWCLPCVAELPEIDAVHRRYAFVQEVEVLVVANDSAVTPGKRSRPSSQNGT